MRTSRITRRAELWIDGAWRLPGSTAVIEVADPDGCVPAGTPDDVDRAVAAASRALYDWASTPRDERLELLERLQTAPLEFIRRPGVVACVAGASLPETLAKVVPALAAGCTVVLAPSDESPLGAFLLADLLSGVGLPPGVFNLVGGCPTVAAALATHPRAAQLN